MFNVAGDESVTNVRLAQLDRAFGYGPKGRGFESSSARFLRTGKLWLAGFINLCRNAGVQST